jgi:hypothetical protein
MLPHELRYGGHVGVELSRHVRHELASASSAGSLGGSRPGCGHGWIVRFRDGKIAHEHIYWDQASVLVQIGLLDPAGLPVAGVEVARKVHLPASIPSNGLIPRRY